MYHWFWREEECSLIKTAALLLSVIIGLFATVHESLPELTSNFFSKAIQFELISCYIFRFLLLHFQYYFRNDSTDEFKPPSFKFELLHSLPIPFPNFQHFFGDKGSRVTTVINNVLLLNPSPTGTLVIYLPWNNQCFFQCYFIQSHIYLNTLLK